MTATDSISETISKTRGRPPVFEPWVVDMAMRVLGIGRRQATNFLYAWNAKQALKGFDADGADWLRDRAGRNVLTELGRSLFDGGEDFMRALAGQSGRERQSPEPSGEGRPGIATPVGDQHYGTIASGFRPNPIWRGAQGQIIQNRSERSRERIMISPR